MEFQIREESRHTATVLVRMKSEVYATTPAVDLGKLIDDRTNAAKDSAFAYGAEVQASFSGLKVCFTFSCFGPSPDPAKYAAEEFVQWLKESGKWSPGER